MGAVYLAGTFFFATRFPESVAVRASAPVRSPAPRRILPSLNMPHFAPRFADPFFTCVRHASDVRARCVRRAQPAHFELFFTSHQWWHCFVVLAAYLHFEAVKQLWAATSIDVSTAQFYA
eukprot:702937-Prymnesium_polylepis.1